MSSSLSIFQSFCLTIPLSVRLSVHSPVYLTSVHPSVCLSTLRLICLLFFLSVLLYTLVSVRPHVHLSISPFFCLFTFCMPVFHPSVCLLFCLPILLSSYHSICLTFRLSSLLFSILFVCLLSIHLSVRYRVREI